MKIAVVSDERTHLTDAVAKEILEAWFSGGVLPEEMQFVEQVREIERKYGKEQA